MAVEAPKEGFGVKQKREHVAGVGRQEVEQGKTPVPKAGFQTAPIQEQGVHIKANVEQSIRQAGIM